MNGSARTAAAPPQRERRSAASLSRIGAAFSVRPEEGGRVVLLFAVSFSIGLCRVFFDSTSNALFLSSFDISALASVYMIGAVVTTLLGVTYARLEPRVPPAFLLVGTLVIICATLGGLTVALLVTGSRWLAMVLMVWKECLDIILNLVFWATAGFLFDVREGKRLFGLIAGGEILAKILGGLVVPLVAETVGTAGLMTLATLGLTGGLLALIRIVRRFRGHFGAGEGHAPGGHEGQHAEARAPLRQLIAQPYIRLFLLLCVVATAGINLFDFVFFDKVENAFHDEHQLAAFFGVFFAVVGVLNLIANVFVSGRLLARYGLRLGVPLLPAAVLGGITLALGSSFLHGVPLAFFWITVGTKLMLDVLRNSVDLPVARVLYQPLSSRDRLRVQTVRESICEPVATGIVGALLLVLTGVAGFTGVDVSWILAVVLGVWIAVAIGLTRLYVGVLGSAIAKRRFGTGEIGLVDNTSLDLLVRRLESPIPSEAIFCLDLLKDNESPHLIPALRRALDHPVAEVRTHALGLIEQGNLSRLLPETRRRLQVEPDRRVKAAALATLCAIGDTQVFDEVAPFVEDADPELRQGAMIGLLRSGGIDGILLAGEALNRMMCSPEPSARAMAARILGDVGIASFHRPLNRLIADEDQEVRRAAIMAAGKLKVSTLAPRLIEILGVPALSYAAAQALAACGPVILPALEQAFAEAAADPELQGRIARICGRIGGERPIDFLKAAIPAADAEVRDDIFAALYQAGYRAEDADERLVRELILQEVDHAAWLYNAMGCLGRDPQLVPLHAALEAEARLRRDRILRLLAFLYARATIEDARIGLDSSVSDHRAIAIELIDNIVSRDISRFILPLIESLAPAERSAKLNALHPQPTLDVAPMLAVIIVQRQRRWSMWTRATAVQAAGLLRLAQLEGELGQVVDDPFPVIRETAGWSLAVVGAPDGETRPVPGRSGMLTIEKVMILKSVDIFSAVREDWLVELAARIDLVDVSAETRIIKHGEIGRALYVIVSGRVRIHIGDRTVATLGERQVFGELAALDPEPRSADVTALEDATLFRVHERVLNEMMAENVGMAHSIIQVLCRRLRQTNREERAASAGQPPALSATA